MLKRTSVIQSFLKCSSNLTPQYTAEKYALKRGDYGALTQDDQNYLISLVNGKGIVGEKELEGYNVDWMRIVRGKSELMLKPETTEQVSSILKFCHSKNIAVVPQGGNTGLVGGSVPVFDEVILNTSLMNKVEKIDPVSGVVVAQAGCILDQLNSELAEHKLMMPLDLGAKGSCQLGGNISTNAGNHTGGPQDVFAMLQLKPTPAFAAREETKNAPILKDLNTANESLYITRGGTQKERDDLVNYIINR